MTTNNPNTTIPWADVVTEAVAMTQLSPQSEPMWALGDAEPGFSDEDILEDPDEYEYEQEILEQVAQSVQEGKMEQIEPDLLKGEAKRYDTHGDASMRLYRTIVHFDGRPYYIKEVFPDMTLRAWDMANQDILLNANDSRLDIASPKLGFIRHKDNALYPMRVPARQQRQGVEPARLSYFSATKGSIIPFSVNNEVLKQFRSMLMDSYPEFREAEEVGVPISKNWSFAKTRDPAVRLLYHKAYPVAFYFPSEHRFIFRRGGLTRFRHNSLQKVLAKKGDYSVEYHIEESFNSGN